ncbi:glycosyltransferase family 2 protein [Dongia deserti]|uniref:glycosyltransferase family 2 protein n=1 Tax=Dongia deserti TaxID=2268030 RepID=UPI000E64F428|nr:glycosyltransferase family 2 protein [Dongia deserti]
MAFGRLRKLFRREPTRQELYLRLTRGLNIERDYQSWIELWENYAPLQALPRSSLPLSILLVGSGSDNDRAYWDELARSGNGPQPIWPPGTDAPLNEALPHALRIASDYLVILHPSDRLAVSAPQRLLAAFDAVPDALLIFGDEDQIDAAGRRFAAWFKPDFGEDLFLSQNGFGRAVIFRKSVLERLTLPEAVDLDDAIYDLALQAIATSDKDPLHCPGILVHVAGDPTVTPKARSLYLSGGARRTAVERYITQRPSLPGATVEDSGAHGFLRLRHPLPDPLPLVSVVIPTRDRKDLLELCIKGLDEATSYRNKEIIVIDNDSTEEETKTYFKALSQRPDVRIIPAPGPFNYPRLINLGAAQARGEILMTLNNDIEAFEPDWLHEMVSQVSRPGVGLVGCLLLYPDRSIQHAGVIVGLSGVAGHMYGEAAPDDPGYAGRILVAQDLSAVTGACQVMRRSLFEQLGGLDERHLAVAYNDIDFCLRVREAGLRVIYTPHARLLHRHSASRGSDIRPERLVSFAWEREYMRERWAHVIFDDPFFNPNLSLSGKRGRLATAPRPRIFKKN